MHIHQKQLRLVSIKELLAITDDPGSPGYFQPYPDPCNTEGKDIITKESFGDVLLFHSRYLAPATHSARFYREYFQPAAEHVVEKERRRWLIAYRGAEFHVHLDRLIAPARDGWFLEIKSRTWSRRDALDKAAIITELLGLFGTRPDDTLPDGYVEFAAGDSPLRLP